MFCSFDDVLGRQEVLAACKNPTLAITTGSLWELTLSSC